MDLNAFYEKFRERIADQPDDLPDGIRDAIWSVLDLTDDGLKELLRIISIAEDEAFNYADDWGK